MVCTFHCRSGTRRNWITFSAQGSWIPGGQSVSSTFQNRTPYSQHLATSQQRVTMSIPDAGIPYAPLDSMRPETSAPDVRLFQFPLSAAFPWLQKPTFFFWSPMKRVPERALSKTS